MARPGVRGVAARSTSVIPRRVAASINSTAQSTCTSACRTMFASTDGLPGPLKLKRFGNRGTITPKNVTGPSAQISDSRRPPGPTGSMRVIAPVNASNLVANTSTSHGYVAALVRTPPE